MAGGVTIIGGGGNDFLTGGAGDDVIKGGGSTDWLEGGDGDDLLDGGDDLDWATYLTAHTAIRADLSIVGPQNTGQGSDTFVNIEGLAGGDYADILRGDSGYNMLSGNGGDDLLDGRGGEDNIAGGAGTDELRGGDGDDHLYGGSGDDLAFGEAGDDEFIMGSENGAYTAGDDILDGGQGLDVLNFTFYLSGVYFDMRATTRQPVGSGYVTIRSIEGAKGSEAADRFIGDASDNLFQGQSGDDIIDGGAGVDTAAYRGNRSQFSVTWTPDGWKVADLRPQSILGYAGIYEGVDLVKNVEFLKFYDGTVSLTDGWNDVVFNLLRTQAGAAGQLAQSISSRAAAGTVTGAQGLKEVVDMADATTTVATLAYQFFTGKVPTKGGVEYLIAPDGGNASNLNSAYYAKFDTVNRYINFAVNLGKNGEAKDSFAAKYGAMSLFDATKEAYKMIFGGTPTDAKVHALIDTRVDYLANYGGDGATGIGTKAAMVGFLLAAAATEGVGVMARSNDAWMADLADGSAPFAIDILDPAKGYYKADFVFGG